MDLAILSILSCILCSGVNGFNLDQNWPILHYGPDDSLFGYSVALHQDSNVNWILVGAPKDVTAQPDVDQGGTVYKCPTSPIENLGICEKIPLDTEGSANDELKSHQYMGATVRSGGVNGDILACAPRFVWKTVDMKGNALREPVGQCILTNSDFTPKEDYTPCRTNQISDRTLSRITHCQAGFSAELLENGQTILLGTPGSFFMQGQLYVRSATGQKKTGEGRKERDDNYRGFAVSYGEFTDDQTADIVSGAPRASFLQGQVEVFSSDLESLYNFTGDQLGAYFGSEVITADVNGDGLDDVIVGAPMYSDERAGFLDNWECGKISVYYQESSPAKRATALFKSHSDHILGTQKQARFGYSMTSLGDINYDGYDDIAVGAPYDGPNGEGSVYIFNGNASGLVSRPSQVLSPTDLGLSNIKTFGFSLDGNMDADGNNYPDLLIGSQESSFVALFRARPVVHISPVLTLTPEGLNLDEKNLRLSDGTMVSSFQVDLCFSYSGRYIPNTLGIIYTIQLDTLYTLGSRVLFYNEGAADEPSLRQATVLPKGEQECLSKTAYVKPNIVEKLAPIQVSVEYALENSNTQQYELEPILSYSSQSMTSKQVFILNNCKDNLCVPNLVIKNTTFSLPSIVVGSEKLVTLNLHITNAGEDAFQAKLRAYIPDGLQFVRIENVDSLGISVTCTADDTNNIIICDLGNPLMPNFQLPMGLTLSTDEVLGDKDKLDFYVIVTSQNEEIEATLADNERNLTLSVEVQASLRINNASNPEQVQFMSEDSEDEIVVREISALDQIGPVVEHVYDIRNDGPSIVGRTTAEVWWPLYDSKNKYALYVIDVKPDSCSVPSDLENQENYPATASDMLYDPTSTNSRRKRQVTDGQLSTKLQCSFGNCVKFTCEISQLLPGEGYDIRIKSRFWNQSFIASGKARIEIKSSILVNVKQMPYAIATAPYPSATNFIATTAVPERPPQGQIAWWIILLAILCGLLLLFLIIIALWKCGFFKRKKYMEVPTEDVNGKLAARI
ncbi:integrin alpha-8-like isoform X2 [Apostichopus japonicus]|uniref:integrin alpha-8-like isoform X2 n=1 Tax=Stichopus japonicus TaxID=307972 RepID=UPI003AB7E689